MKEPSVQEFIYRPYITVKGKRITRPNGGMFKIPVTPSYETQKSPSPQDNNHG